MPLFDPPGVFDEGTLVSSGKPINFIGSGVAAVDNPSAGRVDVTVSSGGLAAADLGEVLVTPSGTSDRTSVVQAALDAAAPSTYYADDGKAVRFVAPGTIYTDALTITKPWHGKWFGSKGLVQLRAFTTSRTTPQLTVSGNTDPFNSYSLLEGIYFYGNRAGPYVASGLKLNGLAQFTIRNCDFEGWTAALDCYESLSFEVLNSSFYNNTYGAKLQGLAYGIAANAVSFYGCAFGGNDSYAVYMASGSGVALDRCRIENNGSVGVYIGIFKDAWGPSRVSGCYFESNGSYDVQVANGSAPTVIESSFFYTKSGGTHIRIESGAGPVVIDSCFASNSYALDNLVIDNRSASGNVHVTNSKYTLASGSNAVTTTPAAF